MHHETGSHASGQLGFHSLHEEVDTQLSVTGQIPAWVSGTLLRNGPGTFQVGDSTVDHWFDGLAMVQQYQFGTDGQVTYRNRFLRTEAYAAAKRGEFDGGFATGSSTLRERLLDSFLSDPYDNTNIIIERIGEDYLALTESPRWVSLQPETLETTGHVQYDGPMASGDLTCSHLQYDSRHDTHVTFDVEFGRQSYYHVYEMHSPNRRKLLASIPVDRPAYMHSFALTDNYVVLTEFPFDINPLAFFKPGRQGPFIENFTWRPEVGTRLHIIDRIGGEVVGRVRSESTFGFHHINAFESDGDIIFDLETVPDAEAVKTLSLATLRQGRLDAFGGRIHRYRISDPAGRPQVTRTLLYEGGTALPTVSPAVRRDRHRYIYAQGTEQPVTEWPTAIQKIDTETKAVTEFDQGGDHFSEPIFVPAPDGATEDDGIILTVALDTEAACSRLLALDGKTLTERARAPLPHAVPFDFHGRFFPELTG